MSGGGLLHRMTCHDNPYDSPYVMAALVTTRESQWQHMTAGAYMCAGGVNRRPVHDRAKAPVTCHVPVTRRCRCAPRIRQHAYAYDSMQIATVTFFCHSLSQLCIWQHTYAVICMHPMTALWQHYDSPMTALWQYIYIYIYIWMSMNLWIYIYMLS